uniref:Uncharacterized protein n=1 Tax=Amphilophus citrinellus TaxID=61819 RepID=A0A3Q0SW03_AMPCI
MRSGLVSPAFFSGAEPSDAMHLLEGRLDMATLLIEKGGVPLESRDSEGRTALHVASWQGCVEIVDLLSKHGANPNAQDGATALSIAAQEGHTNIVAMLLERGADPNHIDKYGRSPVKVAGKHGHFNIVRLLESYGAKPYLGVLPNSSTVSPSKSITQEGPPSLPSVCKFILVISIINKIIVAGLLQNLTEL